MKNPLQARVSASQTVMELSNMPLNSSPLADQT
jgi:hypothetical protein